MEDSSSWGNSRPCSTACDGAPPGKVEAEQEEDLREKNALLCRIRGQSLVKREQEPFTNVVPRGWRVATCRQHGCTSRTCEVLGVVTSVCAFEIYSAF